LSRSLEEQTLALAGIFQAAALVQQLAHRGQCAPSTLETSIGSLFATNPPTTLSVFGELKDLREGLSVVSKLLQTQSGQQDIEILRYALNLIHLEAKLRKQPDMIDILGSRIEQARHTADHFGFSHINLINNLASVYTDTISTFRLRIQVTGDPNHLRTEETAARVRALLLAGIRSAVLWHQTGGRRWHLVFYRKRVVECARRLSEQANQSVFH
tara:strand:+ start:9415 stop:10056 length:642 start_codon:yes stop_codon:yes gene_type:complete